MADETARKILQRQSELESERASYEAVWETVANYCAPDAPEMNWRGSRADRTGQAERHQRRSAQVYDTTIISAVDRLTAGLESLITPQSEKWHGITTAAIDDEETDEEKEWGEGLRDFLFGLRYSASSYFVPAIQAVYEDVVRFGPAYLYGEEGFGASLIRYASIPVNEGFIARNRWGEVDIFHRRYQRTAREVAQLLYSQNKPLPRGVAKLVNDRDPAKALTRMTIIQAIEPRNERRTYSLAGERIYLDSPFVSRHVLEGEQEVILEKSFNSFPISVFGWKRQPGDTYGTSPVIKALTTVLELNVVRQSGLRGLQQLTDPAIAMAPDLDFIPVLNPGASYPGLIDEKGNQLFAPLNTGANPSYAFDYAGTRSTDVNEMLYVNLFQTLVQNPQMTATEALIRQEEKGALLGPAGSVIQSGFSSNLDRELTILEAKGLYADGSRFLPPDTLQGKDVRPVFTSPLDVLRRSAEARDTMTVVTTAAEIAKAGDPEIMDEIDTKEALRIVASAGRAPQRLFRSKEEKDALRLARQQQQEAAQGLAAMTQMAQVAKDGAGAAKMAGEAGMLDAVQTGAGAYSA